MDSVVLKVKKLYENSVVPEQFLLGAGMDLTVAKVSTDDKGNEVYDSGVAVEIPYGYVGLLFPRSGIANTNLTQRNSVGVIDCDYRGPIMGKYSINYSENGDTTTYNVGDKFAQLVIVPNPEVEVEIVEELSETVRNTRGFSGAEGKMNMTKHGLSNE